MLLLALEFPRSPPARRPCLTTFTPFVLSSRRLVLAQPPAPLPVALCPVSCKVLAVSRRPSLSFTHYREHSFLSYCLIARNPPCYSLSPPQTPASARVYHAVSEHASPSFFNSSSCYRTAYPEQVDRTRDSRFRPARATGGQLACKRRTRDGDCQLCRVRVSVRVVKATFHFPYRFPFWPGHSSAIPSTTITTPSPNISRAGTDKHRPLARTSELISSPAKRPGPYYHWTCRNWNTFSIGRKTPLN